ncbi:MAG: PQQ-dependent sugar dehydrogenase [Planctomycetota bacterium]|jgi:hypothetical protein
MTALSRVHAYLAYGLLFAAIACAPACGGGGGSGSGSESNPTPTGGGIDARQRPSLAFPTGTATPMPVTPTRAFRNLSFSTPVFLTSALDTTDRIFVVEKGGRIKVFPNDPGAVAGDVTVFLDISSRVLNSGEMGLLGLAFPPGYATKQQFYVHYITDPGTGRTSRISRFTVPGATPNQADPSSEEVILEVAQPASNHNSGMLAFGPDGFLYVSFGDGGGSNDQFGNGQARLTPFRPETPRSLARARAPNCTRSGCRLLRRRGGSQLARGASEPARSERVRRSPRPSVPGGQLRAVPPPWGHHGGRHGPALPHRGCRHPTDRRHTPKPASGPRQGF